MFNKKLYFFPKKRNSHEKENLNNDFLILVKKILILAT